MDPNWQQAGERRQAYFTNLRPGHYQFQVTAANEDGIWSTQPAVLDFYLPPTFYQRLPFKILVAMLLLAAIGLVVFTRLDRLQQNYRRNLETRLAERERIARDIHDTLLQSVQALLHRLQMWETRHQLPEPLRSELASVASQTRSVVLEGRERILSMRKTDSQPADLAEAIADICAEVSNGQRLACAIGVKGEAKPLANDAKEELLSIGREAIRNAYQHAQATNIQVTVEYLRRALVLKVEDDGIGFELAAAERADRQSHFGLIGMRERAAQLRAKLSIHSEPHKGTTITVIVPGATAYLDAYTRQWRLRRVASR
jgi:signal transduction histidine kinase